MRLITWNCCSGPWPKKLEALESLEGDLTVIPECPRIRGARGAQGTTVWTGTNPRKGLGVIARAPWQVRRLRSPRQLPKYVVPVAVSGPVSFLLLAIWAQKDPVAPYVRGLHRAVTACRGLIERQPTVLLGDFNSNAIWDHEHPSDLSHSALVRKLGALGLVSAYHSRNKEAHGSETRPTFYLYRHATRPYHIDYCFVPAAWAGRLREVNIGGHTEWAGRSDHMPLVVDVEVAEVGDGGPA
ncbi:MAG: endonuclease/exonuclease/phosphatase family protein [Gemmatimonadales bacterium]